MNGMDALLEQLHDIEGLDPINAWPLAIGWWIIIGLGAGLLLLAIGFLVRWLKFRRSWKYDSLEKLNDLLGDISHSSVTNADIQEAAVLFSEYLRRIALRRYSRKKCAGLTGQAWLEWLAKHDAKHFDWIEQGKLLIYTPYARVNPGLTAEQLKKLILAAKEWVC